MARTELFVDEKRTADQVSAAVNVTRRGSVYLTVAYSFDAENASKSHEVIVEVSSDGVVWRERQRMGFGFDELTGSRAGDVVASGSMRVDTEIEPAWVGDARNGTQDYATPQMRVRFPSAGRYAVSVEVD